MSNYERILEKDRIGVIIRFFNERGYGFIRPLGQPDGIFTHITDFDIDAEKDPERNDFVRFDLAENFKGLAAVNVRIISKEEALKERGHKDDESRSGKEAD